MSIPSASALPQRLLGRTGCRVSALALGGVTYNKLDDAAAAQVVNRALDLGITYIDTAHSYTDSERKIGLVMRDRREGVFLATKSTARDYDGMCREIEESFRRLRTDRLDCVQLHDLKDDDDLRAVFAKDGALKAVESFRATGSVRFVGVTGHRDPAVLVRALESYAFDTVLAPFGAIHHAVRPFHAPLAPVAKARGVGLLGMKVMAYAFLAAQAREALRFVMGLDGVVSAVVGMDDIAQVERNAAWARSFEPLSTAEEQTLLADARRIYQARAKDAWFVHLPA